MSAPLDLAIVGVSALFPGTTDATGFWNDILDGRDRITDVPPSRWLIEDYYDPDPKAPDKTYSRRGAFLDPTPFDPLAFGMPPATLPGTDSGQLLALVVAGAVLEDAKRARPSAAERERTSVILGVTGGQELFGSLAARLGRPQWKRGLREHGLPEDQLDAICDRIAAGWVPWQEASFPGLLGNVVAGRIAHRLDLHGTNCVVDAACASALSALRMAAQELALGHSDLVITGGVDTLSDPFMYMCFSKTPALSKSGDCRPFSADGDGTLLGEGLCMVALRRLADAERDGDHIYAVLEGLGASSDGLGPGVYAPVPEGQALALRRSWEEAQLSRETIELIEGHGTGTRAGDAAELAGLKLAFGEAGAEGPRVALGSVKAQIGHTKAAAGAAGLFKAVMALHHKVLPPTIKVDRPHPDLDATSPVYLNTRLRPWIRDETHPRRAGISAFGFGGSDFHATLQEYTGPAPRPPRLERWPAELLLFSADNLPELATQVEALLAEVEAGEPWITAAWRSQDEFHADAPARLGGVASDLEDLRRRLPGIASALRQANGHGPKLPPGWAWGTGPAAKLAFLFPGQGSQSVGMGADLALSLCRARQVWDRADTLSRGWGARLSDVVFPRPTFEPGAAAHETARLTATEWAQPALGAASLALLGLLQDCGVYPDLVAGHSFGELVALHAAGALSADALLDLARARGVAMAHAASGTDAGMCAVMGDAKRAEAALSAILAEGQAAAVVIANRNAPDQLVLAGPKDGLEQAEAAMDARGFQVRRLPVATAFHSPVVAEAATRFAEVLRTVPLRPPGIPVFRDETARPYAASDPEAMRAALASQLAAPVRFQEIVEEMLQDGVGTFVEVGPGAVLTGLVGRCLAGRPHVAVALDRPGQDARTSLLAGLAAIAAAGHAVDARPLRQERRAPTDPRQRKKPAFTVPVAGPTPGAPYPPGPAALARPTTKAPPPRPQSPAVEARDVEPAPPVPEETPMSHENENQLSVTSVTSNAAMQHSTTVVGDASGWILAARELQQQTAAAHATFVAAMHQSHMAWLRTVELSMSSLATLAGAQPAAASPTPPMSYQPLFIAPPAAIAPPAPVTAPVAARPAPAPAPRPVLPERPATASLDSLVAPRAVAPAPKAAPAPKPAPAAAAPDLQSLLLDVVADRTGYPSEMLDLEMALAADLGVDSIKRVEILSALRAAVPSLPELDVGQVASLRTLRQVLEALQAASPRAATPLAAGGPAAPPNDRRLLLVLHPQAAPGRPITGFTGKIAVQADTRGLGVALAERLRAAGHDAFTFEGETPEAEVLVLLDGVGPFSDGAGADAALRASFQRLRSLARRPPAVLVSVQDSGGSLGLIDVTPVTAHAAGFAGLARCAAREWPGTRVKVIDCAWQGLERTAAALATELLTGGDETDIALAPDQPRRALRDAPLPTAATGQHLRDGDVLLVTGGARGVTAWCVEALCQRVKLRVVLLGRTALADEPAEVRGLEGDAALKRALLGVARARGETLAPATLGAAVSSILAGREVRDTLRAIDKTGASAIYEAVDVGDPLALGAALTRVRQRWGPIAGLVHGAGVLADAKLEDKTDAAWDRVYDTKVGGFEHLLAATVADPLRLICAFSSVAARYGNAGQSDYAAANEVLTARCAAEAARRPGCRAVSLLWGPWEGGMVTPALRAHFEAKGVALVGREEGGRWFTEAVTQGTGPGAILLGGGLEGSEPGHLVLRADTHPWLLDHRVRGVPVLPVVQVIEWFARTSPHLRDLRVLRGVELDRLDVGVGFQVQRALADGGTTLSLLLAGETRPRYRALATSSGAPAAPAPLLEGLRPLSQDPYAGILFHGPALRALDEIAVGPAGATARVAPMLGPEGPLPGWSAEGATDVRALDALLQLALVWMHETTGRHSLPTGVGQIDLFSAGPWRGPLSATLVSRSVTPMMARCDIWIAEASGATLARLGEVELHALAG